MSDQLYIEPIDYEYLWMFTFIARDRVLKFSHKAVLSGLWTLLKMSGRKGAASPSQEELAAMLGLKPRTVREAISDLKNYRLIEVTTRHETHETNLYRLPWGPFYRPLLGEVTYRPPAPDEKGRPVSWESWPDAPTDYLDPKLRAPGYGFDVQLAAYPHWDWSWKTVAGIVIHDSVRGYSVKSYEAIGRSVGLSKVQAGRILCALADEGLLRPERRYDGPNVYSFNRNHPVFQKPIDRVLIDGGAGNGREGANALKTNEASSGAGMADGTGKLLKLKPHTVSANGKSLKRNVASSGARMGGGAKLLKPNEASSSAGITGGLFEAAEGGGPASDDATSTQNDARIPAPDDALLLENSPLRELEKTDRQALRTATGIVAVGLSPFRNKTEEQTEKPEAVSITRGVANNTGRSEADSGPGRADGAAGGVQAGSAAGDTLEREPGCEEIWDLSPAEIGRRLALLRVAGYEWGEYPPFASTADPERESARRMAEWLECRKRQAAYAAARRPWIQRFGLDQVIAVGPESGKKCVPRPEEFLPARPEPGESVEPHPRDELRSAMQWYVTHCPSGASILAESITAEVTDAVWNAIGGIPAMPQFVAYLRLDHARRIRLDKVPAIKSPNYLVSLAANWRVEKYRKPSQEQASPSLPPPRASPVSEIYDPDTGNRIDRNGGYAPHTLADILGEDRAQRLLDRVTPDYGKPKRNATG